MTAGAQINEYLDTLSLEDALWWFIENMQADGVVKNEVFFRLRERIRES